MKWKAERPGRRASGAVTILDQIVAPHSPQVQRTGKKAAALLLEEGWNLQIAKTIYKFREQSGLARQDLAEGAGVSISTRSSLEDADLRRVSWAQRFRIARALALLPDAVGVRGTRGVARVPQNIAEAKRALGSLLRKRGAPSR